MSEQSWEQQAVDEIIAAEEDDCLNVTWSSNGLCPCCGTELGTMEANEINGYGGYFQLCDSCGWESEIGYD